MTAVPRAPVPPATNTAGAVVPPAGSLSSVLNDAGDVMLPSPPSSAHKTGDCVGPRELRLLALQRAHEVVEAFLEGGYALALEDLAHVGQVHADRRQALEGFFGLFDALVDCL